MDETTLFCGIDPGYTGYVTVLNSKGELVKFIKTPITEKTTKINRKKNKYSKSGKLIYSAGHVSVHTETDLDEEAIRVYMSALGTNVHICIEKQFMIPGQGVASSSKTLIGYGFWRGLTLALGMTSHLVSAKDWQEEMLDIPEDMRRDRKRFKDATKVYSVKAVQAWNKDLDLRKTKKCKKADHNLSDSICIARFCWQTYGPNAEGNS